MSPTTTLCGLIKRSPTPVRGHARWSHQRSGVPWPSHRSTGSTTATPASPDRAGRRADRRPLVPPTALPNGMASRTPDLAGHPRAHADQHSTARAGGFGARVKCRGISRWALGFLTGSMAVPESADDPGPARKIRPRGAADEQLTDLSLV